MTGSHLTFVIPPHIDLRIDNKDQLTNLSTLAKHSTLGHIHYNGAVDCVIKSLGIEQLGSNGNVPVAAVERLGAGLDTKGRDWCIKAQPVNLIPNRSDLVMRSTGLDLTPEDLELSLLGELNDYLAELDVQIKRLDSWQWIVESEKSYHLESADIAQAANQNIREHIAIGDDAQFWRNISNEIEMWLHARKNQAIGAETEYQLPNSLWFWGAGSLPQQKILANTDLIVGDGLFLQGLAKLCAVDFEEFDRFFTNCAQYLSLNASITVFLPERNNQVLLDELDNKVFSALQHHLSKNNIQKLSIVFPNGNTLDSKATRFLSFLSRGTTLEQLLNVS